MVKVALVISTLILGVFSFVIADAYSYTALINSQESYQVLSGQWSLVGVQFVIGSLILALVFIIKSRKR
jgi:membrane protein implicated in regulation of membrane protease activity